MLARETVELLIQAARIAQSTPATRELGPAEWMALRFFARANAHSRKPSALADFEASSRAAVSHIVQRLEQGGYLTRTQSPDDGRSYAVEVTEKGLAALQDDPIGRLVQAVRSLPQENRGALHAALRDVLTDLAKSGARRQFDICRDCGHLFRSSDGEGRDGSDLALECTLFNVAVDAEATNLLCAHFTPAAKGDAMHR